MQNIALTSMIAAATLGLSTSVFAQQSDEIALRSQDGTVNLTGAFVSFEDNVYELRTELGLLRISGERVDCFGDACPIVLQQAPDASGKITLRSLDGLVEITGTLLSFENNAYLIETGFGKLEVAADVSVCDGAACPVTNLDDKEVRLAGFKRNLKRFDDGLRRKVRHRQRDGD